MPLHVSSTCAHHQEVKIALNSLSYHHTYRWPSCAQVERVQPVHKTATYRCDDTRGCLMQFWPPDDEHMCSKHIEAWNKLIVKQKCCASSWLITEINTLNACSLYPIAVWQHNLAILPSSVFHSCASSSVGFYLASCFLSVIFLCLPLIFLIWIRR